MCFFVLTHYVVVCRILYISAVLCGRYSNGKVWAISAKNSATGTEMFGGKVDEVCTRGSIWCLVAVVLPEVSIQ